VKGSANEKRLASQFISKFFGKFTKFANEAFDALLDLIEDEDINIRKQAIRDLPTICKDSKQFVPKTTDILTQLLVAEDASELQIINSSLVALFKLEPKGFLTGLFSQIISGEEITRDRAVHFLVNKYRVLPDDLMTREYEETLIAQVRKAMDDCTKDEFVSFMSILSGLKLMKLVSGQQIMMDIITEQADTGSIDSLDAESLDKLLMCVKYAIPYFSPFVNSNLFVTFFCQNLLPVLDTLIADVPGVDLEILQYLAEMIVNVQPAAAANPLDVKTCQQNIFDRLIQLLPLPPPDVTVTVEEPSLQLTHVESLLFAFHQITKHNTEFLTANEEVLKDFKLRLQYLARGVQNYIKKLRESLSSAGDGESDENKLKFIALKTTTNINTLIRDLFHSPPTFKSVIHLSWKPISKQAVGGQKRSSLSDATSATLTDATSGAAVRESKRKPIEAPVSGDAPLVRKEKHVPPAAKFAAASHLTSNNNRGFSRGSGKYFFCYPTVSFTRLMHACALTGFRGRNQYSGRSRGRGRGVYSKRYN
jgi:hypothetical protein